MGSDDSDSDSSVGFNPLKKRRTQIISESESEEEPTPGCSKWNDTPIRRRQRQRNIKKKSVRSRFNSDNDSDYEEVEPVPTRGESNRRHRRSPRNKTETSEDEGSETNYNGKKNERRKSSRKRISAEKQKRARVLEKLHKERSKRKSADNHFDNSSNSAEDNKNEDDEDKENNNDEDEMFEVATSVFSSKYSGKCRFPECPDRFEVGLTKIVGVYFDCMDQEKPAWICAKHWKHHQDSDASSQSDEDYIDNNSQNAENVSDCTASRDEDSNVENSSSMENEENERTEEESSNSEDEKTDSNDDELSEFRNEMDKITQIFSKQTSEDEENKIKYLNEHSKYQLEIHSNKNKALYLSPEKRLRRNMRTAHFDKGRKDDNGLCYKDDDYQETIECFVKKGQKKVKVFPNSIRISQYNAHCQLKGCKRQFVENQTKIIGIMQKRRTKIGLNSQSKKYWICYDHVK